ncbi:hypothetical protein CDN98_05900 [Roseateles terrae]|nr:hypothetical protein CDN98_05900 [Roseateles terrae]
MPAGIRLDPQAAALAGGDPAAIQLFQRLTAQFGTSVNWLPDVVRLGQLCNSLSPAEQRLVQRHLFSANAAQLDDLSALRHDPEAMAEVLAGDDGWADEAAGDGPAHAASSNVRGAGTPLPEKSGRPDESSHGRGPAVSQGRPPMPGPADFQRAPGSGRPGAPSSGMAASGYGAPPMWMPGPSMGRPASPASLAPSAPPTAPSSPSGFLSPAAPLTPGSPYASPGPGTGAFPTGGYGSPPPAFGTAGAPGWSGAPASPLAYHAPAPAGWPGAAQPPVVSSWSTSFNGGAPMVFNGGPPMVVSGAPPMVFNGTPPVMVANYPCLPTPPLAWDACGGFMPYQPFQSWNPWMGGGFGMPSPYYMPDLPSAGMSLGMGVGAALASGVGSLLGSFAFGHHHCW